METSLLRILKRLRPWLEHLLQTWVKTQEINKHRWAALPHHLLEVVVTSHCQLCETLSDQEIPWTSTTKHLSPWVKIKLGLGDFMVRQEDWRQLSPSRWFSLPIMSSYSHLNQNLSTKMNSQRQVCGRWPLKLTRKTLGRSSRTRHNRCQVKSLKPSWSSSSAAKSIDLYQSQRLKYHQELSSTFVT